MYLIFKNIVDFLLSSFLLVILSPALLLIIIILKLFTSGSVFFIHYRIGKNGKIFKLYKFRTMKTSRDIILKDYFKNNPQEKLKWEENYKLKKDPRITKIGYFLREFSLDEFPQLLNIIKGDMSFIGPRPIVNKEISKYGHNYNKYKTVKPGLTGLWQVSGRNNTTYKQRVDYDMYYIQNRSFILDCKIFLKTIPVIISRKGAY